MVTENIPEIQSDKVWWVGCEQAKIPCDLLKNYTIGENDCQTSSSVHGSIQEDNNTLLLPKKIKSRMTFFEMAPSVIGSVKRMQEVTHMLALICFVPGLMLLTATPFMVIPIFVFPTGNKSLFVILMLAEWCAAFILITAGVCITNLHWHYDTKAQRLRCTLRCNQKPKFRFWGTSSFSYQPFDDIICNK